MTNSLEETPATAGLGAADNSVQMFTLANGLRLLVKEDHRLPFVEFRTGSRGGSLAETPALSGLTQLLAKLLVKGTPSRTAEQIAIEIESVGGHLDTFGGNNSFGVTAEVMREDFPLGLELVAEALLHPSFPDDALEREREVQLADIRSQRDDLLRSAELLMRRSLFGSSGYGMNMLGTEESVTALTVGDLRAFHSRLAVPNNCVLAIYGDVSAGAAREEVEKVFGAWKPNAGIESIASTESAKAPAEPGLSRATESRDKKQAVVVMGFPGTTIHAADRFALELIQETCSDLGSRLFMRIRDRLGLAYYTGAKNFLGLVPGYFAFYAGTEPEKVSQVETEMLREVELLRAEGLTAEELKRAKAKVIGQKKISRQDLGSQAMASVLDELYGLGYANSDTEDAKFEAVSLEEVQATARKYLRPEAVVTAVVGPERS